MFIFPKKASDDYIELNQNRWRINQNTKHESLAKFVKLIEKTKQYAASDKQAEDIYEAAVTYAIISVKDEWKYMLYYPEGSYLPFNNGSELVKPYLKEALNKTRIKEIDRDTRVSLLGKLVEHVRFLKEEHQQELESFCHELNFDELDAIYTELDSKLLDQRTKKNSLSWPGTAVKYSIQGGITLLIGGATGFTGAIAYLAGGSLLVQEAINSGISWIVDKAGTKGAEQAVTVANIAKEGLQKIFNHPSLDDEDKEDIVEWITTLLTLPEEVMCTNDKARIRTTLGIKKDERSEEEQVREIVGVKAIDKNYVPRKFF